MPTTDFQPLLDLIGEFWKQHENLPQFKKYWEGLVRSMDDEWLQLTQTRDSLSILTLPTTFLHTFLYRELSPWEDTGVFHRHFKKSFRALAGQKIFYLGAFVEPETMRVFMEGKELDGTADPYTVTYDQDATQPGTNPRGTRIVFVHPVPTGASVQAIADRETVWIDHTFTASQKDFAFSNPVNPLSLDILIESMDITNEIVIDGAGTTLSYSSSGFTSPASEDTRVFYVGERLRVIDGLVEQVIQVSAQAATLTIPVAVSPTARVLRLLDLNITPGRIVLETTKLSIPGQSFSPGTRVRVIDSNGAQTFDITSRVSVVEFGREIDISAADVTFLSGSINRIDLSDTTVSFSRSFQVGVRLHIRGEYFLLHDHAVHHVELADETDRVSVDPTRPWVLSPALAELPELPIEVYVDGMLQHPSAYHFLPSQETRTVRFLNGTSPNYLPAGTAVDIYYADHEDDRHHQHVNDYYVAADGQMAFELTAPHDERYPVYIRMDGVLQNDPDNYGYTKTREFIQISPPIVNGTIVKIGGMRLEFPYQIDVDTDLVENDFTSADPPVPVSRMLGADYLQNGIDRGISSEVFESLPEYTGGGVPEVGFSVTPITSTLSGFALKSSSIIEEAWFKNARVDEQTAWRNFGNLVNIRHDSSLAYTRTLQGVFAAYYRGSQRYTLENFICLIMGSAFLDAPGRLVRFAEMLGSRTAVIDHNGDFVDYDMSTAVSSRLRSNELMPRFHALSAYCEFLDLTAENCPWFPAVAEDFAENWTFAKRMDTWEPSHIHGSSPTYTEKTSILLDAAKDFVAGEEGEVWVGDLLAVTWSGGTTGYGRVTEIVDKNALRVRLDVPKVLLGYGAEAFGGGSPGIIHGYGGSRAVESIVSYEIVARKTRRLDTHRFMDALAPEDFPYVTNVLIPLFQAFVSLIRFDWEGLREGLIEDVKYFLDTAKGAASGYIAFSQVNNAAGLSDTCALEFADENVTVEMLANVFAVGLGAIDGTNPVGSSIELAT